MGNSCCCSSTCSSTTNSTSYTPPEDNPRYRYRRPKQKHQHHLHQQEVEGNRHCCGYDDDDAITDIDEEAEGVDVENDNGMGIIDEASRPHQDIQHHDSNTNNESSSSSSNDNNSNNNNIQRADDGIAVAVATSDVPIVI
eukprot:PhM_4_TR9147/c1_g1_i1/m.90229